MPLPAARGREGMIFEPTGEFIKQIIAPSCGLDEISGTWRWGPNGNVVIQTLAEGQHKQFYPVKERPPFTEDLESISLVIISLTRQRLYIQAAPTLLYR
jgi:hypothetical protein